MPSSEAYKAVVWILTIPLDSKSSLTCWSLFGSVWFTVLNARFFGGRHPAGSVKTVFPTAKLPALETSPRRVM